MKLLETVSILKYYRTQKTKSHFLYIFTSTTELRISPQNGSLVIQWNNPLHLDRKMVNKKKYIKFLNFGQILLEPLENENRKVPRC